MRRRGIRGASSRGSLFAPRKRKGEKIPMAKVQNDKMDKLVALCKGRGFIFPGSEI